MELQQIYINTIVNSKSITEAISRVAAMSEIRICKQQNVGTTKKQIKKAISEKQVANNDAINTVICKSAKTS